jgi:hypothetical protein
MIATIAHAAVQLAAQVSHLLSFVSVSDFLPPFH